MISILGHVTLPYYLASVAVVSPPPRRRLNMEGISERYGERRDGNIATDMAHVRSGRQKRRGTDIINGRH